MRKKPQSQKDANRTRLRGTGERANIQLKYRRILHNSAVALRADRVAKAIHVLQNYEITAG
jgi:hypothetical protein